MRFFLCVDCKTNRVRRYVDGTRTCETRIRGYALTLAAELEHFRLFGLPAYTRITT